MHKLTIVTALCALAVTLAGCTSGGGVPDSSISLINRDTQQLISTVSTTGDLTLHVGDIYHFKVERLQATSDDTQTSDVTTVATYSFIPDSIAVANSLGELRALATGTTQLEARFRPDQFASADRVYLNVTVVP